MNYYDGELIVTGCSDLLYYAVRNRISIKSDFERGTRL